MTKRNTLIIIKIIAIIAILFLGLGGLIRLRNLKNPPSHKTVTAKGNSQSNKKNISTKVSANSTTKYTPKGTTNPDGTLQTNPSEESYPYDIAVDRKTFNNKKFDLTIRDKLFATQINDIYKNFSDYEGKTISIEGFYIDDFKPYEFIGRYGPSCPFCNGGYVSFEIKTDKVSAPKGIVPLKDWVEVQGIIRKGENPKYGPFYYIEAINLIKKEKHGKSRIVD